MTKALEKVLFLDFDDVICLNKPYGGHDVFHRKKAPPDLWERLFSESCKQQLREINDAHHPSYVLTTSWVGYADRAEFERILVNAGLPFVVRSMHRDWCVSQGVRDSRADAIRRWLDTHEPASFLVLDDESSGTGLKDWPQAILCTVNVGLSPEHVLRAQTIFQR